MIVFGSTAIHKHFPSFRQPHDLDVLCWKGEVKEKIPGVEFIYFDEWTSLRQLESVCDSSYKVKTELGFLSVVPPAYMCAIKRSHLYRQHNWYKHINDFHFLWRGSFSKNVQEFYEDLYEETTSKYPDKTPSLNKTKDDFFDDYVEKHFEHDWLHLQMAHYDRPLYERCQRRGKVYCHQDLWNQLSFNDKCNMVREEALVIGLERILIPKWKEGKPPAAFYKNAFMYAIMRICTNLCGGWFREFAQLNFPSIIKYDFRSKYQGFEEKYL